MSSEKKISVLITFYNQESFVDKAISSVVNQKTDFSFKIIIGDDGSSDETVAKINEWIKKADAEIELVEMEREGTSFVPGFRASALRLELLKHVETEFFIFLDGDDYFSDENKLQKQFDILTSQQNADCVVCAHGICYEYMDGKRTFQDISRIANRKLSIGQYWGSYYLHTDTMLIRSRIIPQIDADILQDTFNDTIITYAIMQHGKMYVMPDIMAVYVQNPAGLYVGSTRMTKNIREIMDFDTANIINPRLKRLNRKAYASHWKRIFLNRKDIDSKLYSQYAEESKRLGFKNAERWAKYSDLTLWDKVLLFARALFIIGEYEMKVILLKSSLIRNLRNKFRK